MYRRSRSTCTSPDTGNSVERRGHVLRLRQWPRLLYIPGFDVAAPVSDKRLERAVVAPAVIHRLRSPFPAEKRAALRTVRPDSSAPRLLAGQRSWARAAWLVRQGILSSLDRYGLYRDELITPPWDFNENSMRVDGTTCCHFRPSRCLCKVPCKGNEKVFLGSPATINGATTEGPYSSERRRHPGRSHFALSWFSHSAITVPLL
jgi:hypothetical protein